MNCARCGEEIETIDDEPAYTVETRADNPEAIHVEEGYGELPVCLSCKRKARRRMKARKARRSQTTTAGYGRGFRCQNDHRGPHTL